MNQIERENREREVGYVLRAKGAEAPKKRRIAKRVGALVIGIIGGISGIVAALLALGVGGLGAAFGASGASTVMGLGSAAFMFCLLGFVGSGIALAKPRAAALLLLISGIGFIVSVSAFAIVTGPLFLIAALLAFFGRGKKEPANAVGRSGA